MDINITLEKILQDEKPFLSSKEFVNLTGIPFSTMYSYVHFKQIPNEIYRKRGRSLLFIRRAVFQWIIDGMNLKKRPQKV